MKAPLPDLNDLAFAESLQALKAKELTRVRGVAAKWQAALGGVVGVLTTVLVVKGPESVDGLADWAKIVIAVLTLGALAVGVIALLLAIYSANGFPSRTVASNEDAAALELEDKADQAVRALRRAIILSVLTVVLLAGSVGVSWFAQRGPVVWVVNGDDSITCGSLASADGKVIVLEQNNQRVEITLSTVKSFEIRDACTGKSE